MKTIKLKQFIEDPKHLIKTEAFEHQGEIALDEEFIGVDENGVVQHNNMEKEKNDFTGYGDCWGENVENLIEEAREKLAFHKDEETISFTYDGVSFMAIMKYKG